MRSIYALRTYSTKSSIVDGHAATYQSDIVFYAQQALTGLVILLEIGIDCPDEIDEKTPCIFTDSFSLLRLKLYPQFEMT